ncbi:hypothetical protein BDR03DRAFT_977170 [Suillus americanus]|nr:hypothetical protein BDR03DRAFT_977170 [Suillus americanus]
MFQKRLRITPTLSIDLIAAGRLWVLWFNLGLDGIWPIVYRLGEDSRRSCSIKPGTDSELRPQHYTDIQPGAEVGAVCGLLGEWLMDNNTIYVDSDGTLHAQLKMTCIQAIRSPADGAAYTDLSIYILYEG